MGLSDSSLQQQSLTVKAGTHLLVIKAMLRNECDSQKLCIIVLFVFLERNVCLDGLLEINWKTLMQFVAFVSHQSLWTAKVLLWINNENTKRNPIKSCLFCKDEKVRCAVKQLDVCSECNLIINLCSHALKQFPWQNKKVFVYNNYTN